MLNQLSSDAITLRLSHILEGLATLRDTDSKLKVFGARHHKYLLRPCASEQALAAFEEQRQVRLPEEYRRFLLEVGDGGAGPSYGLESLSNCLQHLDDEASATALAQPFPHLDYWNPMDEWRCAGRVHETYSFYEAEFVRDENVFGSIVLSNLGCGMTNLLIVSGPQSGSVWLEDRCNSAGIFPLMLGNARMDLERSDGPRIGFLDWYEHWLSCSLAELD